MLGAEVLTPEDCNFDKGLCGWTFQREKNTTKYAFDWLPHDTDGKSYVGKESNGVGLTRDPRP